MELINSIEYRLSETLLNTAYQMRVGLIKLRLRREEMPAICRLVFPLHLENS